MTQVLTFNAKTMYEIVNECQNNSGSYHSPWKRSATSQHDNPAHLPVRCQGKHLNLLKIKPRISERMMVAKVNLAINLNGLMLGNLRRYNPMQPKIRGIKKCSKTKTVGDNHFSKKMSAFSCPVFNGYIRSWNYIGISNAEISFPPEEVCYASQQKI